MHPEGCDATEADVAAHVAAAFEAGDHEEVGVILAPLDVPMLNSTPARLKVAALLACGGDADALRELVALGCADPRDLMVAAWYRDRT